VNNLLASVPTTLEEAVTFLDRGGIESDRAKIAIAANSAAIWMERHLARRLVSRTYRTAVAVAGCVIAANSKAIAGAGFAASLKQHDAIVGPGIAPGSRIESVDSDAAATMNNAATAPGDPVTLTAGSEPLVEDGTGKRTLYCSEFPLTELFAARSIANDGTETALDIAGYRLDRKLGLLILTADGFPQGDANVELECRAGYRAPSATERGDDEWATLQWACHRLMLCLFKDQSDKLGRAVSQQIGAASVTLTDFRPPADVVNMLAPFRRGL
jgi:hypothetical protein